MASNSASFKEWLGGKCCTIDPPVWSVRATPEYVRVVPAWGITVGVAGMLLGIFAIGGFFIWLSWGFGGIMAYVFMALGGVVTVALAGVFGAFLVVYLIDNFRGAFCIYSVLDHTVSLPREGVTVPISDVLGWRLVSGNWVGPEGSQKRKAAPMSELQLIVKGRDGAVAYAVAAGDTDSRYVVPRARRLAEAMGVPLEVVTQRQGVSNPPQGNPLASWWSTSQDN